MHHIFTNGKSKTLIRNTTVIGFLGVTWEGLEVPSRGGHGEAGEPVNNLKVPGLWKEAARVGTAS